MDPDVLSTLVNDVAAGAGLVLLVGLSAMLMWWIFAIMVGLALRFWHQ